MTEAERAAWLERRTKYLGASDVPAIIGIDPYRSALDVWASKTGLLVPAPESAAMANGNRYERAILDEYAADRMVELSFPGHRVHASLPWASCTPDAVATAILGSVTPSSRLVQAKAVGRYVERRWGDPIEGVGAVPDYVQVQVQWEMFVAGMEVDDVVAKGHVTEAVRIYEVPRDEETIGMLVDICGAWWERHVVGGEMPEIVEGDRALEILRARFPNASAPLLPSTEEVEQLVRGYDAARAAEQAAEADKKRIAAELCLRIGEAEGFEGAWGRATWKLRAAHARPAVQIGASRVLRVALKDSSGKEG